MRQSRNSIITLKNRILLVFLVFFQISLANTPISYTEYNYLVNFFKMASGEKWKTKWDVTTNNVHEGGWYGVTVENGKVVEINLEDNNLEGSIYSGIDNLKGLRSLNLSTNKLTGVAPFNFGNLAALELLNLKDNKLTGISKGFSATLNLDISSQKLDYLVFTYLGDDVEIALPEICVLDAAPNKFKVTILVGNKTNVLEITATEENKLIIPKSFIESCNLDLNVNSTVQILQISGLAINTQLNYSHIGIGNVKIPEAEYNALKELYTSTAGLGWKIRWDISKNNVHEGNWHGVKVENGHVVELNLESNQLRGSIPASINNLKLLRFLNFNNNVALEGTLSKEIEGLKELTALHLYNCRFSGDIPLNFTQMPKLKTIDFRYNQFTTIKAGISRGITLYLHNQNITYDQFRYRGDSVAVKLPNIMLYDYAKDNYSVKNTMYFYINNNYVATMIPNDEGYVKIPKEVLGSLNSKDVVRIYQNNGTSSGTNINFKTIDILTPKIPDSEYEALVAIYKALNGPNWGNSAMLWDVSSNNLHTSVWPGVTIEDGHVVGLNLQQAYYKQGVIPKEIGDLTMLRALNLNRYSYQLTGKLPDEIGNLVNLVTFSATDNKISGEIPTSFGNLTKLKVLDLNTNTLVGSVPSEFSNLQNLETLNLNSNQLSGKLPVFLPELPSLTTLGFYNNNFVGSIPKEYGSKIKLSSLDLRYNKLDSLDSGIARGISVNLEYQSLTRDLFKFTGDTVDIKLPAMMRYNYTKNDYSARNNIYLRLNNGNVGNPLQCNDEGIIRIPKEYFATLNKNHKVSLLQEWASGTSSYSTLTFDSVFIETKKIPDSEYEALVAIYKALNGPNWGNSAMLWDISSNNLHTSVWPGVTIEDGHVVGLNLQQAYYKQGVIPKEIGDLTMLRALNLNRYSYQLTGKLPDEIGNLVNLETFSATDNKISGEIPTSFGNLTKLKVLDLNTNTLVGSVPSEFNNLQNLETLNLNSNQLSGQLPVFLPELSKLTTLGFYNNNFVGSIPKEYDSKIKLSSLDLRYNKLDSLDSGIARGISVNLEYQTLTRDLFKFTGDTVDIKLPAMMRYNYTKNDYSARNNIYLRLNNGNVGNPLQCNDEGIIRIPKEYFTTLNKNHKVSLFQEWGSGTSSYSTLTFDSVFIETKKIPDLEYEALVAIYNALNGPKWGNNAMVWDISSNNLHTSVWPGVTIEDGHVVGLNLYQAYYKQGVIPKEIGNLTMLRTLNLDRYSSYITGKLPDEIGNLVNLETFSIANNSLSAEIPTSFNNLAKLKVLNVSYNSLSGSLPSLFATSSALNTVNLYQNKIDNIGEGLKAGMSIDIRYQQPRRDVFIYTGDTVDIQMPSVMLYDYSTNGSVTSNKFDIRYNNAVLATDLYADENGIIRIPKEVLGTLRTQQSALVSIYQNTGTASYSSLIFDSVKVNLDPIPQKEYEALIAIYNKMGGSKWSTKWDVTKGNNVHEGWYGVALENGHVVSINLYNNNLSGNIPVEIGDFSKLRILNLSNYYDYYNRNISGDIPTEIGKLTNLEELYIYNQSLTGELAFWIDKLERLKVIQLYNNYLTGSLPESIQKLTNLQDLNLGINKLEGGIPDRLGNLQYLQYLNLSNNQFKGTIPESLNDLPSITTLYLNNNMFDAMETKLPYQPHITVNIQNQKIVKDKILISGEDYVVYDLPIVSRYDHTRGDLYAANSFYVYVDNSKFPVALKATEMGRLSIPRSYFNNLKTDSKIKLEQADGSAKGTTIEFDEFYIGKPVDDKEYQALVDLYNSADGENWTYPWDVSKNNLDERMWYGVVVEDGHVVKLELQNNRLKGELKESLGQLTSLKQLSLYNNNLTGNIPTSLGTLDSLTNVYLYKNKFTGNIPSSLFDLKNLKELLFNSNQLSGDISDKIATLSKLKVLNISDNSFEGTIPDALFKLPAIKLLDVSLNKYYNMNQAFSYASDVSIYLESQNVEMSDFVLVEGTSVKAKSIKLNQYDKIAHSFDAKNKFELYVDDEMIGQSEIIEDGFIIFNVTLKGYDETDNVYVIQRNGSAYGTTIYYKGVKDASQIQIEETEYLALVSLYNALDGANWTNKWDVSQNNINSGEWYGVNFSNGHITGLELESNKLSGNLPDIFKDLPYLTDFNIAVNSVKGNIPASLMNLESLNKVVLSDNALSAMDEVPFRKSVNLNMARQNVEFPEFNFNLTSEFTVSNIHKYNHSTSSFEKEVSYTLIMGTFNRNIKVSSTYILAQIMKRWSVPHGQLVELQLQGTLAGNNSRNRYYLTFKEGDVDMNDTRNILDIQLLITDMQNQVSSSTYFNETAADVNNDGKRNILDVVAIASLIQNEEMETEDVQTRTFGDKISTLSIEDGILYLNTASPVNAFDIRIKDGNIKEIERIYKDEEMSISIVENDNEISILGFSVSGSAIEGKVAIVKVGDVVIDNAILSNSDAQAISWRVGDYVTGIEDENESLEGKVYNYPNPFETSTTVQFDLLEEPSSAELIIYNITGKIVYREKLTDLIVGTHRLTIDRRNLASGVYPYHVRIQTKHGVKIYNSKMIIK